VFANLAQLRAGALVIGGNAFLIARSEQLAALAFRHAVPAIFQYREFVQAVGLMSYGGSILDAMRLVGVYTGRILRGEKPADLPVQQGTRVLLTTNLKTAKALGITFPLSPLGRADEVNADALRSQSFGHVSSGWHLHRQHPQGREAWRSPGYASEQV
jgi:putative ABC transport system substrate-binding protein